jgi:hypothetical protein
LGRKGAVSATETYTIPTAYVAPASLGIDANELFRLAGIDQIDADNSPLKFALDGITIIYGMNGSGKSDYFRVLNHFCRSPRIATLRSNVFAKETLQNQKISMTYIDNNGERCDVEWKADDRARVDLGRVSVFDSNISSLFVDEEQKIEILPYQISLMEQLVSVLNRDSPFTYSQLSVPSTSGPIKPA